MTVFNGDQNPNNLNDVFLGGRDNDTINGLSGSDFLDGGEGSDRINGGADDDQLFGGGDSSNDTLDGGTGADFMEGGKGNDIYFVDNKGDTVQEFANGGIDTVNSSLLTFRLPDSVENLILFGNARNGLGNDLDNIITGNDAGDALRGFGGRDQLMGGAGNDLLDAGDGDDVLQGSLGNDTLNGGAGNDTVNEVGDFDFTVNDTQLDSFDRDAIANPKHFGTDTLQSIERVNLIGGNLPNQLDATDFTGTAALFGNNGSDVLIGGHGADELFGGAGNDQLTGGQGADHFVFKGNPTRFSGTLGVDSITALEGSDRIVLDKATFTTLKSTVGDGLSVASDFAVVANDSLAATSTALITYSLGTGNLFYNQNGSAAGFGTGNQFATLVNKPALSATNFAVETFSEVVNPNSK